MMALLLALAIGGIEVVRYVDRWNPDWPGPDIRFGYTMVMTEAGRKWLGGASVRFTINGAEIPWAIAVGPSECVVYEELEFVPWPL